MRPEIVIAVKDLRLLARDRMAAFFTFVFPLAVALFFGLVFGGGQRQPLQVAVWNGAKGEVAAAFVRALAADDSFTLTPVPTRDEGEKLVRTGRAVGLVVIPESFDERADDMLTGNGPTINLLTDPARAAESGLLEGKIYQVAFQTLFQSFGNPAQMDGMINQVERATKAAGMSLPEQLAFSTALRAVRGMAQRTAPSPQPGAAQPGDAPQTGGTPHPGTAPQPGTASDAAPAASAAQSMAAWTPIRIESGALQVRRAGPTNSFAISFLQGLAWALFGAVLSFSSSMADEHERGTLLRLLVAPIGPLQVLMGKAGACFVTCVVCECLLVGVGALWFGVVVTSVPLFALATVCTAFAFTGVMMALAAVFRTQGGAQGAARAVLLLLAMIGGGTVPLFFMPPVVQTVSNISPFKWAVVAAEGATWRAWSPAEMVQPIGVLLAIGVVAGVVALVALRRRAA